MSERLRLNTTFSIQRINGYQTLRISDREHLCPIASFFSGDVESENVSLDNILVRITILEKQLIFFIVSFWKNIRKLFFD